MAIAHIAASESVFSAAENVVGKLDFFHHACYNTGKERKTTTAVYPLGKHLIKSRLLVRIVGGSFSASKNQVAHGDNCNYQLQGANQIIICKHSCHLLVKQNRRDKSSPSKK